MKEAPSFERAFLVSATPTNREGVGAGTDDGGGMVAESVGKS